MADHILRVARKFGPYRITSSCRNHDDQARLYQDYLDGKTGGLPVALPGHSAHERGLAMDIARPDLDPFQDPFLKLLGMSWRELDRRCVWGESDPVHFEWRP